MLILAFDTTNERGGVAIHRDLQCLASAENEGGANYSITLFQTVDRLLSEAHLKLSDIDLFAVAVGPGSFTGIRVGVAAAQGWAQAIGRPVCGVSVLEAMSEQARPHEEWTVPILDARRGEFYLGVFRRSIGHVGSVAKAPVAPEPGLLLKRDALGTFLGQLAGGEPGSQTISCVVREHDTFAQAFRELLPDRLGWQVVRGSLAGAIARRALVSHREGRAQSPAELDAFYLRRSDAEMHWTES